MKSIVKIS